MAQPAALAWSPLESRNDLQTLLGLKQKRWGRGETCCDSVRRRRWRRRAEQLSIRSALEALDGAGQEGEARSSGVDARRPKGAVSASWAGPGALQFASEPPSVSFSLLEKRSGAQTKPESGVGASRTVQ